MLCISGQNNGIVTAGEIAIRDGHVAARNHVQTITVWNHQVIVDAQSVAQNVLTVYDQKSPIGSINNLKIFQGEFGALTKYDHLMVAVFGIKRTVANTRFQFAEIVLLPGELFPANLFGAVGVHHFHTLSENSTETCNR